MINDIKDLAIKVENLTKEEIPQWGKMSPQHMVEHLAFTIELSLQGSYLVTPEEQLPKLKAFLLSEKPFPKHFKSPIIEGEDLPSLKEKDLASAKILFFSSIEGFYRFYRDNQDNISIHPIFGPLNGIEWEYFHKKHIKHHFQQFNLL